MTDLDRAWQEGGCELHQLHAANDDQPRLWPEHWAVVAMVGASVVVGGYAFAKLAGLV